MNINAVSVGASQADNVVQQQIAMKMLKEQMQNQAEMEKKLIESTQKIEGKNSGGNVGLDVRV